jgi:hypothetical protein
MHMQFPSEMYIDYVRVYQREGISNGLTCDPPNRPTANYINKYVSIIPAGRYLTLRSHLNAYTNPNLTTWSQAGYNFPTNTLSGC